MKQLRWTKENILYLLPRIRLILDSRIGPVLTFESKKMKIGLAFCHRRRERSFTILGYTFPLCSRCTGLWLGFVIGLSFRILDIYMPSVVTIILVLPLIVDGLSQLLGLRESNNPLRLLTGILFGIATHNIL